jgi:SAM-dependent methyltransferase
VSKPKYLKPWLEVQLHDKLLAYHRRQFDTPYRSTVAFCDWLAAEGKLDSDAASSVLDVGCGMGANTHYMSRRFPNSNFRGIDVSPTLVKRGREELKQRGAAANCHIEKRDLYALPKKYRGALDGVISFQLLSWLPSFERPVKAMASLARHWIAASSLFNEGDVDATIRVRDYTLPAPGRDHTESYYNVYALLRVQRHFAALGFDKFRHCRFDIDLDLAKPLDGGKGTYTERLADGRRLQISGPVLMSWYFIVATRS